MASLINAELFIHSISSIRALKELILLIVSD
jgi:hypothetical protein